MTNTSAFYHSVIDDVIDGVREELVNEGLDSQVLTALKKLWLTKLADTHAVDPPDSDKSTINASRKQTQNSVLLNPRIASQFSLAQPRPTLTAQPLSNSVLTVPAQSFTQASSTVSAVVPPIHQAIQFARQHVLQVTQPISQSFVRPFLTLPNTAANLPQFATLPSGVTVQLLQIENQSFLVPQTVHAFNRPIGEPPTRLICPPATEGHLTGAANGQCAVDGGGSHGVTNPATVSMTNTVWTPPSNWAGPLGQFAKSQVDGGHDSDETNDSQCYQSPATHNMAGRLRGVKRQYSSIDRTPADSFIGHTSSDTDDDDFMPSTPVIQVPRSDDLRPAASALGDSVGDCATSSRGQHLQQPWERSIFVYPSGGTLNRLSPANLTPSRKDYCNMTPASIISNTTATPNNERLSGTDDTWLFGRAPSSHQATPTTLDGRSANRQKEAVVRMPSTLFDATDVVADGAECNVNDIGATPMSSLVSPCDPTALRPLVSPGSNTDSIVDVVGLTEEEVDDDDGNLDKSSKAGAGEPDQEGEAEEDDPLNSEDDVSDDESDNLFDSQNVVVCQFDKIHRSRNRWRLYLKDGVMSLDGRDFLFQKATGDAEW